MKLELKHLAPYLPYDLICEVKDQGKTKHAKLSGAYIDNSYTFFDTVESEHGYDSIKPILKPMTDILKPINNDETNVTYASELKLYTNADKQYAITMTLGLSHEAINELFKWHFDVFGLIPEGLAIDINTLK